MVLLAVALGMAGCERKPENRNATGTPPPASGAAAEAGDLAAGADVPVIVCLGDSLTAGHGLGEEESWPYLLQQRLDAEGYAYRVVNAGVSGDTSAGGLSRMDWLLKQRIDILIVELGANDGLRGLDPASTRENLDAIIRKGRESGAQVVLAGMQMPINYGADYKRRYDAIFPALAEKYDLPFIPFILEGVAGRRDLNLPDGIHPTGDGYRIVLDTVWETLEPLLRNN